MLKADIEKKVREVLQEGGDVLVDIDQIALNEELKDFGINSVSYLKIIMDLEEKFRIMFEKDELQFENFRSIDKITECIASKLSQAG